MVNPSALLDSFSSADIAMQILLDSKQSYPDRIQAVRDLSFLASSGQKGLDAVFATLDDRRLNNLVHRDTPELSKEIRFLQNLIKDRIDGFMQDALPNVEQSIISDEQIAWLNNITSVMKLPGQWKIQAHEGKAPQAVLVVPTEQSRENVGNLLSRRGIRSEVVNAQNSDDKSSYAICIDGFKLQKLTIEAHDSLVEIMRISRLLKALNISTQKFFSAPTGNTEILERWIMPDAKERFDDCLSLTSDDVVSITSYSESLAYAGIKHEFTKHETGLTVLKIPLEYFSTVTADTIKAITNPGHQPVGTALIDRNSAPVIDLKRNQRLQSSKPGI